MRDDMHGQCRGVKIVNSFDDAGCFIAIAIVIAAAILRGCR